MTKPWEPIRYSVDSDTLAIEIRLGPAAKATPAAATMPAPTLSSMTLPMASRGSGRSSTPRGTRSISPPPSRRCAKRWPPLRRNDDARPDRRRGASADLHVPGEARPRSLPVRTAACPARRRSGHLVERDPLRPNESGQGGLKAPSGFWRCRPVRKRKGQRGCTARRPPFP
jgi:hypothetical protein